MKSKILIVVIMAMAMMMSLMPMSAIAADPTPSENYVKVADMIAGGGNYKGAMDVGDILIWNDGSNLHVKYVIIDPMPTSIWVITETHLAVALHWEDIPQANGNPIPGQFEKNDAYNPGVREITYDISIDPSWVGYKIFFAAHATVQQIGGLNALEYALPNMATLSLTYPIAGGSSYFPQMTITNGGILNGVYPGWCVDTDHTIGQNAQYTVKVYSSYESLPSGLVAHPENFDLVNWILNQGYVGTSSPGGFGTYTYGDVQKAIWMLIETTPSTSGLGPWDPCRVNEIIAAAQTCGEGFIPGCNQFVAVVLAPVDCSQVVMAQVTILAMKIPCPCVVGTETAWGIVNGKCGLKDGKNDFPGKNWAEYIPYQVS